MICGGTGRPPLPPRPGFHPNVLNTPTRDPAIQRYGEDDLRVGTLDAAFPSPDRLFGEVHDLIERSSRTLTMIRDEIDKRFTVLERLTQVPHSSAESHFLNRRMNQYREYRRALMSLLQQAVMREDHIRERQERHERRRMAQEEEAQEMREAQERERRERRVMHEANKRYREQAEREKQKETNFDIQTMKFL